jgi:hypothetical protein
MEGLIPDLYAEMHQVLALAKRHLAEIDQCYKMGATIVQGAKALVFQAAGYCREADALREGRSKAVKVGIHTNQEVIEAEITATSKKLKGKEEAEKIQALIRQAEGDRDELARIIGLDWPKEAFVTTRTTNVSTQATKETRAIIIRERSAADVEKLQFLERQFPGARAKAIAEGLKIGRPVRFEATSRISFETDGEGNAENPTNRVLFVGKLSGAPVVGPRNGYHDAED